MNPLLAFLLLAKSLSAVDDYLESFMVKISFLKSQNYEV